MPVKLYMLEASPPVRAVLMALEIFSVPNKTIEVNLLKGEHLKPEFLKINPLHTIPTMEDGDLVLHDSHAMLQYLADTYGKTDSWYPKDTKARALVNQKLFFETSILFPRLRDITYPAAVEGDTNPPKEKFDKLRECYDFLETFLTRTKFLAGDHMTIADLAAFATVSSSIYLAPIDAKKYPKTAAWLEEMENQSVAKKANEPGRQKFCEMVNNLKIIFL